MLEAYSVYRPVMPQTTGYACEAIRRHPFLLGQMRGSNLFLLLLYLFVLLYFLMCFEVRMLR